MELLPWRLFVPKTALKGTENPMIFLAKLTERPPPVGMLLRAIKRKQYGNGFSSGENLLLYVNI